MELKMSDPVSIDLRESLSQGEPVIVDYPVKRSSKIGRNQPCPCGSGKKYKRCCGR